MIPREIQIQDYVLSVLSEYYNIYPFSVYFTETGETNPKISITFFGKDDLNDFLDILGYKKLCDKSGLYILYDKNTVILSDMIKTILFDLLSKKVNEDEND